ncbi:PDZ domain-containing protein, partial [Candidatus Parcubacteria bacterium]|nr:PDZ domain-containing protein [Candidatus Parcubacteria bacterium]
EDLVLNGTDGTSAVTKGSAAEKAGLKEKDLILEFNQEKITKQNSMQKIIAKYNPGDQITLKFLRDGKEMNVGVVLGERS